MYVEETFGKKRPVNEKQFDIQMHATRMIEASLDAENLERMGVIIHQQPQGQHLPAAVGVKKKKKRTDFTSEWI